MTLAALREAKLPFAAPSANPSGAPSPKCAEDVMKYFDGRIAAVIDGGECGIGRESTIIDMSAAPYKILRQGALPEAEIVNALMEDMTVIGITGGTGCGKTTALRELKKRGALIIDCDALYHELLESDEPMITELKTNFPGAVVDGVLDRKSLGRIVFSDSAALLRLNAITHRHVDSALTALLRQHAMAGGSLAAIDAIELISSGVGKNALRPSLSRRTGNCGYSASWRATTSAGSMPRCGWTRRSPTAILPKTATMSLKTTPTKRSLQTVLTV